MSSLEFIKKHSSCWFSDSHDRVQMIYGGNNYGAIHFWSTKSNECFMSHFFDDCDESFNDNKVWTREEFEAYYLDSKKPPVSTVNRDIERASCETIKIKKVDIDQFSVNKYVKVISDKNGNVADVDVYDVLKAFNVICPATQHAVKKLLCSGARGHKDIVTDLKEARDSIVRAIELNGDSK